MQAVMLRPPQVYSFLDINPCAPGHALVIPKKCYEFLHEVPEETSAAIGRVLPRIAKAVMQATGTSEYNILQNNGAGAHQVRGGVASLAGVAMSPEMSENPHLSVASRPYFGGCDQCVQPDVVNNTTTGASGRKHRRAVACLLRVLLGA